MSRAFLCIPEVQMDHCLKTQAAVLCCYNKTVFSYKVAAAAQTQSSREIKHHTLEVL